MKNGNGSIVESARVFDFGHGKWGCPQEAQVRFGAKFGDSAYRKDREPASVVLLGAMTKTGRDEIVLNGRLCVNLAALLKEWTPRLLRAEANDQARREAHSKRIERENLRAIKRSARKSA